MDLGSRAVLTLHSSDTVTVKIRMIYSLGNYGECLLYIAFLTRFHHTFNHTLMYIAIWLIRLPSFKAINQKTLE